MESTRLHRLLLGLALLFASQLPATADATSSPAEAGNGVRTNEQADPVAPRERPRLKDNEVVSLKRRLEVHGGMSFTYGWAGGGRNFREVGAWASYFDPATGLGLAVGISHLSGDVPYDYGYGYGYGSFPYDYARPGWYSAGPGTTYDLNLFLVRPNFSLEVGFSQTQSTRTPWFDGTGYALRSPAGRRF